MVDNDNSRYQEKVVRVLPKGQYKIVPHPRVEVLCVDDAGFTRVLAKLLPGESVCWRCATPAQDPDGKLSVCPTCGGDFND